MANDIYLSSTLNDLGPEREAVHAVLKGKGLGIRDSYRASENDLIESCLADVGTCKVYVGIVGMRYGHRPHDIVDNPNDRSITELEFREARRLKRPCFVFVKAVTARYEPAEMDFYTGENDRGDRIKAFRAWLASESGIVADTFETTHELREKLLAVILDPRLRLLGPPDETPLMFKEQKHPAELTAAVGFVLHPALHADVPGGLRSHIKADARFQTIDLAPDDPRFLSVLDEKARTFRTLCWLLTPPVIRAYRDNPGVMQRALIDQTRRRSGVGALLAEGTGVASIPGDWTFGPLIEADEPSPAALDAVFGALGNRMTSNRHLGIPYLVLAMTQAEALALVDEAGMLLASIRDEDERRLRTSQTQRMLAAIRHQEVQPGWPLQAYGERRDDWRPFGPGTSTAADYLNEAARRFDGGELSKRERLFIKDNALRLQLLPYALDELIDDVRGSREAVQRVCDQGCLMLVDEMALLHPVLRPWAKQLLKGENVAVLSSQPVDPAPYAVSAMLANGSSLQVGNLTARFSGHDPRCEVAINSPQRLRRWLRWVLPELVPTLGGVEMQAALAERAVNEVFSTKRPP